MKRVFITGATGGLGRNALNYALKQGAAPTACGRNSALLAGLAPLPTVCEDLAKQSVEDLRRQVEGHDAIWHCAALSAPWGPYESFVASNVTASASLFEAAGQNETPVFVHISTPALYFDFKHRYNVREEQVAADPVNAYARTKWMAEQRLQALAQRYPKTKLVILRPRAIFGPYDQVLFPRLLKLIEQGSGRLPLPRGGEVLLDLTYAENVAHAMWLATLAEIPSGHVFNITNDAPCTVRSALGRVVAQELGQPLQIRNIPYAVLAPLARLMETVACFNGKEPRLTRYSLGALAYDMTLDVAAAKKVLGFRPVVSMDEAFSKTAAWLRSAHGGHSSF